MVLASLLLWYIVYEELKTLDNRQWLDSLVCNYYLSFIWHDSGDDAHYCFLMIFRLRPDLQITPIKIDTYRHAHHVPTTVDCPIIPVTFLIHDAESAHYFAMIFNYAANIAYIFRRKIGDHNTHYNPDWRAWQGPEHWQIIADPIIEMQKIQRWFLSSAGTADRMAMTMDQLHVLSSRCTWRMVLKKHGQCFKNCQ